MGKRGVKDVSSEKRDVKDFVFSSEKRGVKDFSSEKRDVKDFSSEKRGVTRIKRFFEKNSLVPVEKTTIMMMRFASVALLFHTGCGMKTPEGFKVPRVTKPERLELTDKEKGALYAKLVGMYEMGSRVSQS